MIVSILTKRYSSQFLKGTPWLVCALLFSTGMLFAHDVPKELPVWTHYLRGGVARTDASGGFGFYRIKRVRGNTFYDLRLLGYFTPYETLGTVRYKSSHKFDPLPRFYKFGVVSIRHSSKSELKMRYHANQGFGAFLFNLPTTHLTGEVALSYDMSDYLNDTRKTSYLKSGLFWDVDIAGISLALDFEYFHQISDVIPGEGVLTRYELSAEANVWIGRGYVVTVGYEGEFYSEDRPNPNVRSVYLAVGFKRLLSVTL